MSNEQRRINRYYAIGATGFLVAGLICAANGLAAGACLFLGFGTIGLLQVSLDP